MNIMKRVKVNHSVLRLSITISSVFIHAIYSLTVTSDVFIYSDRQRAELTSLFVAVACGEDRGVACQQLDRQRFDPSYQRHRHPWAFHRHHPRDRRHPATVLKQPEEREREEGGSQHDDDGFKTSAHSC